MINNVLAPVQDMILKRQPKIPIDNPKYFNLTTTRNLFFLKCNIILLVETSHRFIQIAFEDFKLGQATRSNFKVLY